MKTILHFQVDFGWMKNSMRVIDCFDDFPLYLIHVRNYFSLIFGACSCYYCNAAVKKVLYIFLIYYLYITLCCDVLP